MAEERMPAPATLPRPPRLSDADLTSMLLIRHFEQRLLELFAAGELAGTTHTCLGQEYIPVALNPLLDEQDIVFSSHRGHGHYLARYPDPTGLLAELMGREGAICGGIGGSQHLFRPGFLTTGVQGESLPVAVGVALDLRRTGTDGLVLVYLGDGTWGEGVVYEALNLAALWQVPLLIAVENNGIAQSTPIWRHMAGSIAARALGFGIDHIQVDQTDPGEIRRLLRQPVAAARFMPRPLIVEFITERLGPHSKGDDTRDPGELDCLRAKDWYPRYAATFRDQFARTDTQQRERVEAAVREVTARRLVTVRSS
jgi:acetoin:2,6-dichlorophenolindophenol oxidoreductase subunit alpha